MNILIVAAHYAVCSARYAADAFSRLGHTVKHVGPAMGRDIWGMQVPEEYVWTPQYEGLFDFALDDALVIYMDSDPEILDNKAAIKAVGNPTTIVWGVDSHVRDYRRPYFDAYFLAHKSVSIQPYDEKTFWLPCGYDAVAFPPSPIAWADREFDVCMIGVMYPARWQLVNAMRAAGLKVLAGTGLIYEAYKQAHWNSRVALVSSFNGDLPIRFFEAAGMGCAVLCDQIQDLLLLANYSMAELPAEPYDSIDRAVKLALELQDRHNVSYAAFATYGPKWAANHTWDVRAQVIVDWLEAR